MARRPNVQVIIILMVLLAALLRLYQLPALPPGLNFDEAGDGVAALNVLHGAPQLWWRIGGGKEPLWPWLLAISTALLGPTPLALRLPAALVGVLTVAALVPLSRALFPRQPVVALLAVAGLALSEWHVHVSRLGLRAVLLPLLVSLAFYFFWNSFYSTTRRAGRTLLAAIFLALAVYTYLSARLLPLVALVFAALLWLADRRSHTRRNWRAAAQFLGYGLIFLLPLAGYFALYPADFVARVGTVSIFNPAWNHGDLPGTVWRVVGLSLGTFLGLTGDANPLVNLPGQPALSPLLAPFLVLGALVSLYRAARLFIRPAAAENPAHLFLLCWGAVMLLPALLAPEGAPHHLRLLGVIAPVYLITALGLAAVINFLNGLTSARLPRWGGYLPAALPVVIFALVGGQTAYNYFGRWAHTDFTLIFDVYATRLAAQIAQADPATGYLLPMDVRAGDEARHYTLDYLLDGTAAAYTYLPVADTSAAALLNRAAAGKTQLKVVRWTADKHREADAKEIVSFLLNQAGQPASRESFPVYDLETYNLPAPVKFELPHPDQPINANFDNMLRLDAAWLPLSARPGHMLPVALTFSPLAAMPTDYKASLRLVAPTGERLAQKDRALLHNFHQGTSLWPPEPVNEYYLLPVPAEAPPGVYTVTVVIYSPETLAPLVANGQAEVMLGPVRLE